MSQPGAVPLDQPLRGASFGQAVGRFFKKYATFTGRASRSEYWWWALATFLVYLLLVIGTIVGAFATGEFDEYSDTFYLGPALSVGLVLMALWYLGTLVPQIAVAVRRLHDANFSGWMILLRLLPTLGDTIVFILTVLPPKPEGARFDKR